MKCLHMLDLQIIESITTSVGTLSEEWLEDVLIKSKNCTKRYVSRKWHEYN